MRTHISFTNIDGKYYLTGSSFNGSVSKNTVLEYDPSNYFGDHFQTVSIEGRSVREYDSPEAALLHFFTTATRKFSRVKRVNARDNI